MEKKKSFWKSKTVWAMASTVIGVIATNPPQTKTDWISTGILIAGGIATAAARKSSTQQIK